MIPVNDELDVLRELRPPSTLPDPAVVDRARTALMTHVAEISVPDAPSRSRRGEVEAAVSEPEAPAAPPRRPRRVRRRVRASSAGPARARRRAAPVRRTDPTAPPASTDPAAAARRADATEASGSAPVDERAPAGPADPAGGARPARTARHRLAWRVATVVGLAGAAVAASWATVARHDPALTTTTRIECAGVGTIDVRSGSPVADCAAAWRAERGTQPPQLVAYADESGGDVHVVAAGGDPPADGLVPLHDDTQLDSRLRELSDELADVDRGLGARCRERSGAVDLVETQLARLGLARWSVHVDPPAWGQPVVVGDDADARCMTWLNYLDDQVNPQAVVIRPVAIGEPEGLDRERRLARALHDRMVTGPNAACLGLDEAADAAREEAERLGFDPTSDEVTIETLPARAGTTARTCTRPTTWVGGQVHVTLREVPAARSASRAEPPDPGAGAGSPAEAGGCRTTTVAEEAELPGDFDPPVPGRGGAGADETPTGCDLSATSRTNPGRHLTFAEGTSPYGLVEPHVLANGARRAPIEDGYVAEIDIGGTVVHVLGYGLTLAEFDAVASSL